MSNNINTTRASVETRVTDDRRGSAPQHRSGASRSAPRVGRRVAAAALFVALIAGVAPADAQETIDDARDQREMTRLDELRARAAVDVLDAEFEDIEAALAAADALVELVEARADAARAKLRLARVRHARTEVGVGWAEYDRRIVEDELADLAVQQYLGVSDSRSLLEGSDLNETLTRNAVLEVVQGAGRDLLDTARSAADQHLELQARAEIEIAEIERLEAELEDEITELEVARDARERARNALQDRRDNWLGKAEELEAEADRLTDFIRRETIRAEEQSQLDAQRSEEGWVWPTAGGIGSYFGMRRHPVLGYERLHGGLDIGGRMGQPIWAAKEGVVILAGVKGGYGNTIVIDHGGGYATLYGHQSTFEVSVGDRVETGEHIGNVGSTGLSTGPHLHFEIRIDGTVNDPLPYLPAR